MRNDIDNILVFRIGQLGDTLAAVPALWVIRESFPGARITLLCDQQCGKDYVLAAEVFRDSPLVDDFIFYPVDNSVKGRLLKGWRMLCLWGQLLSRRFNRLVYLVPSQREQNSIKRDLRFFRLTGIKQIIGEKGFCYFPGRQDGRPLPKVPHAADLLLSRLAIAGLIVPPPGKGRVDLAINDPERKVVDHWARSLFSDGKRPWVAIGPGSKMPVKVWPKERYEKVVNDLIDDFDIWPVVFGGKNDRDLGESLVARWGRGYVAAGSLNIRESMAAMERCVFYLGNDTGTLHMAVAAGLKCVGIYSARYYPGNWDPYGDGHKVFQKYVPCEGCLLEECCDHDMACIKAVTAEEVLQACRQMLNEKGPSHLTGKEEERVHENS